MVKDQTIDKSLPIREMQIKLKIKYMLHPQNRMTKIGKLSGNWSFQTLLLEM